MLLELPHTPVVRSPGRRWSWSLACVPFLVSAAPIAAADGLLAEIRPDSIEELSGLALGLLGGGLALVVIGLLFLIRRILGVVFNLALVLTGALLLLAAVFGGPLGIYDRLFEALEQPVEEAPADPGEETMPDLPPPLREALLDPAGATADDGLAAADRPSDR